jgi:DNA repair protein RadC
VRYTYVYAMTGSPPTFVAHSPVPRGYASVYERADVVGPIVSPAAFAWVIAPRSARAKHEIAWVASLGPGLDLVRLEELEHGDRHTVAFDLDRAVASVRVAGSRYAILAHNHPEGDPTPSPEDRRLTTAAAAVCARAGLVLVDHVVLGRGTFYSFAERRFYAMRGP